MTSMEIAIILARITYKDWGLRVGDLGTDTPFIQWTYNVQSDASGIGTCEFGHKHVLHMDLTEIEIVQIAFDAVLEAEGRQCRKAFHYSDKRVFDPQIAVDKDDPDQWRAVATLTYGGWHSIMQDLVE